MTTTIKKRLKLAKLDSVRFFTLLTGESAGESDNIKWHIIFELVSAAFVLWYADPRAPDYSSDCHWTWPFKELEGDCQFGDNLPYAILLREAYSMAKVYQVLGE